jgi:hypothetical protein
VQIGVGDHASTARHLLATDFELRFDQGDQVTLVFQKSDQRREDHRQRDERQIRHDDVHRTSDVIGCDVANVDTLEDSHSLVVSNLRVELSVTDVDGDDGSNTVLEETVGESTSGSTRIDSGPPLYPQCTPLQSRKQLVSPTAHEPLGRTAQNESIRRCDQMGGLGSYCPIDQNPSRLDHLQGLLATRNERSTNEFGVESAPLSHRVNRSV